MKKYLFTLLDVLIVAGMCSVVSRLSTQSWEYDQSNLAMALAALAILRTRSHN